MVQISINRSFVGLKLILLHVALTRVSQWNFRNHSDWKGWQLTTQGLDPASIKEYKLDHFTLDTLLHWGGAGAENIYLRLCCSWTASKWIVELFNENLSKKIYIHLKFTFSLQQGHNPVLICPPRNLTLTCKVATKQPLPKCNIRDALKKHNILWRRVKFICNLLTLPNYDIINLWHYSSF